MDNSLSNFIPVELSPTGAQINKPLTLIECEMFLNDLGSIDGAVKLSVGDILNYAEEQFGDDHWQIVNNKWTMGSIRNMKYVSKHTSKAIRRYLSDVSWSHLYEVAFSETEDQQLELLDWVITNDATVTELRLYKHGKFLPEPDDQDQTIIQKRKVSVESKRKTLLTVRDMLVEFEVDNTLIRKLMSIIEDLDND